jgi:predicted outer membrane repeat protein
MEIEQSANPTIENCTFIDNTTTTSGGGLAVESLARATIRDCVFLGNRSYGEGGGVAISTGNPVSPILLERCTIAGNRATTSGGGLNLRFPSHVRVEHSILWNNCAGDGTDTHAVTIDEGLTYVCSIVDSVTAEVEGSLTYDADTRYDDPAFCESVPCGGAPTDQGDYRVAEDSIALSGASPCGEQIGARGAGCPPVTPVRKSSWSKLKSGSR